MIVRCVTQVRALLGESPVWSDAEQVVYWIDILGKHLHRTDPSSGDTTTWDLPSQPGMIALRESGGLVVALEDGIYYFDPQSSRLELLVEVEADVLGNRANDGKADVAGRLWVGTMNQEDASRASGNLYRVDTDLTVTIVKNRYCIPNGIAWGCDNRLMYHTDTRSGIVNKYDFEGSSGNISKPREFFRFNRATEGSVDGATTDEEGAYWAAFYGGWKIQRVLSNGTSDTEIELPVSQPTMPVFGGPDRRTIYITSAKQNLSDEELAGQPLAGGLLAVTVQQTGQLNYVFGG